MNTYLKWSLNESNIRPSTCKDDALPTELSDHIVNAPDESRTRTPKNMILSHACLPIPPQERNWG